MSLDVYLTIKPADVAAELFGPLLKFIDRQDQNPRVPDDSLVVSLVGIATPGAADGRRVTTAELPADYLTVGQLRRIAEAVRPKKEPTP